MMKNITLDMNKLFGSFCAEGKKAVSLLSSTIYPSIEDGYVVVFDFRNVRNMNSSFGNALFANLVRKYGSKVLEQMKIINTRENVKKEISSNINFGLKHIEQDCAA
jgi:hypothetical protein